MLSEPSESEFEDEPLLSEQCNYILQLVHENLRCAFDIPIQNTDIQTAIRIVLSPKGYDVVCTYLLQHTHARVKSCMALVQERSGNAHMDGDYMLEAEYRILETVLQKRLATPGEVGTTS